MIVVSLLLILVAVMLLVLGLAGGSSTLLISSIGASLLAAVALVIGARRAAAIRRAAMARTDPTHSAPGHSDLSHSRAVPFDVDERPTVVGEPAMAGADSATRAGAQVRGGRRQADPSAFADDPPAQDEGLASAAPAQARGANRDDAEAALVADAAYRDASPADLIDDELSQDRVDRDAFGPDASGPEAFSPAAFDSAARRPPFEQHDDGDIAVDDGDPPEPGLGARSAGARSREDWSHENRPHVNRSDDHPSGAQRPGDQRPGDQRPGGQRPGSPARVGERLFAGGAGFADGSSPAEEFGDPDEDDPADEPLPQAIRPADAVRVARMSGEVLVVDGRPRYHMADCTHLVGRLTEPLPAAEAVELGFSPCGLCRPVDRLVAQATRR